MRSFGRIESAFWLNPKTKRLSDDGRMLLLYAYTCPHGNSIGCFVLPDGYISSDLRWSSERVTERVTELVSKGFIERDDESNLILINGWFGHNTIENRNVAISAVKTVKALPKSPLISKVFKAMKETNNKFLNEFLNELGNELGIRARVPEPEPEPKPEPVVAPAPVPAHPPAREEPDEDELGFKRISVKPPDPKPAYAAMEFHPRFNEIREYIVGRLPALGRQNATEVNRWLVEHGADPELDIIPSIDNAIHFKRGDIGSFGYFTRSIQSSVAVRKERNEQTERMKKKYAESE